MSRLGLITLCLLCIALAALLHNLFAAAEQRLTGYECGPERLTFTADEEDHLPAPCKRVEVNP